jgi:hypothetical protein
MERSAIRGQSRHKSPAFRFASRGLDASYNHVPNRATSVIMQNNTKALKSAPATRKTAAKPRAPKSGEARYDRIRGELEKDHFGDYVMINTDTCEYVVAPTTSAVHAAFIEKFGADAPGWCTRIGISVFATL